MAIAAMFLAAALQKMQEDGRPVLKEEDFKVIVEKNMFSPPRPKKIEKPKVEPKAQPKKGEVPPEEPKPPVVCAFADFDGEFRVCVKDTATGKSRYYKAGETVAGGVIESIDNLNVVIQFPTETKTYHNGDALPIVKGANGGARWKPAAAAAFAVAAEPVPTEEKKLDDIRARMRRNRGKRMDPEQDEEEKPKLRIKK